MYIIPKAGLVVRDYLSKKAVPATGRHVPDYDVFWHRRLRDGDVTLGTPPAKPAATTEAATAAPAAAATATPTATASTAPAAA